MMLGEPTVDGPMTKTKEKEKLPPSGFSDKANAWIKKNEIEAATLDEMFHLDDGKVELILAKAIGKSKRAQTVNTYILTGLAAFLETGDPAFSDETARAYCQHLGCYDSPNHSNYVKAFENKITGSKGTGWKLTAPGLVAAASMIRSTHEVDE
jgi:hypothetical protein